jgi:nitrate/nitrite transporter NarK
VKRALRSRALWRLMLLFSHVIAISLVLSTWLIAYLVRNGHIRTALAGVVGFVVFATTALMRHVGGRLAEAGPSRQRLAAISPLLASGGLVGMAINPSLESAFVWALLMGVGFALPYALMIERAERLFPEAPAGVMSIVQVLPNATPMVLTPLVGAALDHGHGAAAFVALGSAVANVGRFGR